MIPFPNAIPLVVVTIAALAILISFAYQWTTSRQADYATTVQKNDIAFQRIATTLGLTFTSGQVMHHPVAGDIAAFGTVRGSYRGYPVGLRVTAEETTEPPVPFRLQLTLDAAQGTSFAPAPTTSTHKLSIESTRLTLEPQIPCYARSASYQFFITMDTNALHAYLDELCDLAASNANRK